MKSARSKWKAPENCGANLSADEGQRPRPGFTVIQGGRCLAVAECKPLFCPPRRTACSRISGCRRYPASPFQTSLTFCDPVLILIKACRMVPPPSWRPRIRITSGNQRFSISSGSPQRHIQAADDFFHPLPRSILLTAKSGRFIAPQVAKANLPSPLASHPENRLWLALPL